MTHPTISFVLVLTTRNRSHRNADIRIPKVDGASRSVYNPSAIQILQVDHIKRPPSITLPKISPIPLLTLL